MRVRATLEIGLMITIAVACLVIAVVIMILQGG
jgi:hypothetical protein